MAAGDETNPVVALFVVARHGARFPLHDFPLSANWPHEPMFWSILEGRLAQHGAKQLEACGTALRLRYDALVAPLTDDSNIGQRVAVYCTNSQRTVLSAHAFVQGLAAELHPSFASATDIADPTVAAQRATEAASAPANTVQLDVWTRSVNDRLLQQPKTSRKYRQFKRAVTSASSQLDALEADEAVRQLADRLWRLTGFAKLDPAKPLRKRLVGIKNVQTQLNLEQAMNMTPLRSLATGEPPLDKDEIALVRTVANAIWLLKFQGNSANDQLAGGRFGAQNLLEYVAGRMRAIVDGSERRRVYFFSGHDSTLLALLARLNIRDPPVPQFAATISFELCLNPPRVRVRYDHTPLVPGATPTATLRVPLGGPTDWLELAHGDQTLDEFVAFATASLPAEAEFMPGVPDEYIEGGGADDSCSQ